MRSPTLIFDINLISYFNFMDFHEEAAFGLVATTGVCGFSLMRNASFFTFLLMYAASSS